MPPRKKKKATADDQEFLIKPVEYDEVDFVQIGDTRLRLVASQYNGKTYIQLWSSLSKQWNLMYKQNVTEEWNKWKNYASVYNEKHGNGRKTASGSKSTRKRGMVGKSSGVDPSTKRATNSKRGRRSAVKN